MAMVEDVQARLDSYKTDRQRTRRLRELQRTAALYDGYVRLEFAIEGAVLMLRLAGGKIVSAREMGEKMQSSLLAGDLRGRFEH